MQVIFFICVGEPEACCNVGAGFVFAGDTLVSLGPKEMHPPHSAIML